MCRSHSSQHPRKMGCQEADPGVECQMEFPQSDSSLDELDAWESGKPCPPSVRLMEDKIKSFTKILN